MSYLFNLREDMPLGFIKNEGFPENQAVHKFLQRYDGKTFTDKKEFQAELKKFNDYVFQNEIIIRNQKLKRLGLVIFDDNGVGFYSSMSEPTYGFLEEIVQSEVKK